GHHKQCRTIGRCLDRALFGDREVSLQLAREGPKVVATHNGLLLGSGWRSACIPRLSRPGVSGEADALDATHNTGGSWCCEGTDERPFGPNIGYLGLIRSA